jgi:hypothetical protein
MDITYKSDATVGVETSQIQKTFCFTEKYLGWKFFMNRVGLT